MDTKQKPCALCEKPCALCGKTK